VIEYQVILDSNFQGFEIVLEKGFNKIDFGIESRKFGPNTAEFQIYDDNGGLNKSMESWNRFKATIVVTKNNE
jgi:hypothetical protein